NHENIAMPRFETAILNRLCACRKIYWVSDRCGSELNSLVEYPLASAVLVIKPPGSDRNRNKASRDTRATSVGRNRTQERRQCAGQPPPVWRLAWVACKA